MSAAQTVQSFDIAVIGAGPAGLTTALMFAASGLSTALVAPKVNHDDGRTTALLQTSIDLLEGIGTWDDLKAHAAPLSHMRMVDDTGRLIRAPEVTFNSSELNLPAFGYNLLNKDLNRVLEEKSGRVDSLVFVHATAQDYEFADEKASIVLSTGETIDARLVVAADGRNSPARAAAGIDTRRWDYPQVAVVLNLDHERSHGDTSTEFHTPTGPFTLVPLPGRSSSLVCVVKRDEAERLVSLDDAALAFELERRAHSILGKFTIRTRPQMFPLSGLTAKRLNGKRLALIGEAAHVFPPIGAQGLNLSLRDVAELGRLVEQARVRGEDIGGDQVLQAYQSSRSGDINTRTAAVDALNRSLLTDFLPVQIARSAGLYLADRVAPLRRLLMREGIAPGSKAASRSGGQRM